MECGLQLPWRKHYSVLDFLTSSAFSGTDSQNLLTAAMTVCLAQKAVQLE